MIIGVPALVLAVAAVAFLVLPAPAPRPGNPSICPTASASSPDPGATQRTETETVFSDEFDGAAGSRPDPSRWLVETGGLGWGEGELQAYTEDPGNVALTGDGRLALTARQEPGPGGAEFTSARISTCGTFEFIGGRLEARVKLPRGQGLWPAFWTTGATGNWPYDGEIDILESINDMTTIDFNTHQPRRDGTDWELGKRTPPAPSGSWADDWHVVAVDWTRDSLTWSVDGVVHARTTRADTPADGSWVIDRAPQIIVLNLAVGGYPGRPDDSTEFPATFLVDYVRVYANPDTMVRTNLTGPVSDTP